MSRVDFDGKIASIKGQSIDVAQMLIAKLDKQFPDCELTNDLAIVFL